MVKVGVRIRVGLELKSRVVVQPLRTQSDVYALCAMWGGGSSHGADALLVGTGLAVHRLLVQVLLADLALACVRLPAAHWEKQVSFPSLEHSGAKEPQYRSRTRAPPLATS